MPKVYYGLTRGSQTYRFLADAVLDVVGLTGTIGDAYEIISPTETQPYITAIAIMINNTQLKINVQGDYNANVNIFDLVNMRTGDSLSNTNLGNVLATQYASYLGDYDPQTNANKQITVLNDLETGEENVIYASVDFNGDDIFNWIRIGGYSNGVNGKSIYTITGLTAATVFSNAIIGDSVVAGEDFTYDGNSFSTGDVFIINTLSPLSLTANGNVRGAQGVQGIQGLPGLNGSNGQTPTIVDNKWYIGGVDTGVIAVGQDGQNGLNGQAFNMQSGLYSTPDNYGQPGNVDINNDPLLELPTLPQVDISGKGYVVYDPLTTPLYPFYDLYYANNGDNDWTIIHPFSGIAGQNGQDGYTPYIQGGQWYINGVNTGVNATGPQGATGPSGTISVGSTTTGAEGTNASVTNTGTSTAAIFNFTIPKGDTGATGATGATPNISMAATQLPEGASPTVAKSGTLENPIFTLGIPKGDTGDGFPAGGSTGQYLRKTSGTDYDTEWHSLASADITGALGYTPYNSTNPNNYVTSTQLGDEITDRQNADIALQNSINNRTVLLQESTAQVSGMDAYTHSDIKNYNNAQQAEMLVSRSIDDPAGADNEYLHSLFLNQNGINFSTKKGTGSTFSGIIIGAISEVGTGYIRFTTGHQICWGTTTGSAQNKAVTFAKAFNAKPIVVTGVQSSGTGTTQRTVVMSSNFNSTGGTFALSASTDFQVTYIAIGTYS